MRPRLRIDNRRAERPVITFNGKRLQNVDEVSVSIVVGGKNKLPSILQYTWRRETRCKKGYVLRHNDVLMGGRKC